jgi:hypothetical protein
MAVKAEIFGEGPGRGEIRLTGMATTPAGDCSLRIQRNQSPDSYLGLNGRWQSSPESWHSLMTGDVVAMPDGLAFKVGPLLVDPILATLSESAFRLTLQSSAGQITAPLVPSTQFPLLASSARQEEIAPALPPAPPPPPPEPTPKPAPVQQPEPMTLRVDPEDQLRVARGDEKVEKPVEKTSSGKGKLIAGIVAVIVLAAVGAGAYFYFQKNGPALETASTTSPQSTREMLQSFMKDNPDTAKIVGKADEMSKAGNVEAALYLYRQGADHGDARSALQLGILYDPGEATPGASTNGATTTGTATDNATTSGGAPSDAAATAVTKSSDTAAFWYGKAADAGLAEAQRRLGLLLTKTHPAGTGEFDNGVAMLQAASKQGDAEATAKLKELGK